MKKSKQIRSLAWSNLNGILIYHRAVCRIINKCRQSFSDAINRPGLFRAQVNGETPSGNPGQIGTAAVKSQVMMKANAPGRQDDRDLLPGPTVGHLNCGALYIVVLAVEITLVEESPLV